MKKLFYFLIALVILGVVFFVYQGLSDISGSGYVLIGIGHWSVETTLVFFTITLAIAFVGFYFLLRLFLWFLNMPSRLKNRGTSIKFNRSQEALIAGLVDSAEGNFEKAEEVLIKHASHSGSPLIHYLTAAKAAQSRGAFDKRDEYLQIAANQSPDSGIAVGLTQAELHLSGKQFGQALATLTQLHSINPTHASVLKLLHQTYHHLGDWEGIRKLIPSLHTHKILIEAEVKLLETEVFSGLLKQSAEKGDVAELQALWVEVPAFIKTVPGICAIYFAAMIENGMGSEIENELAKVLSKNWDKTLLVLFGSIQSEDSIEQLKMAELWLNHHTNDAILLTVLGKLSLRCMEIEKAEAYLSQSLAIEPTVQAYTLLAGLLFDQGNKDKACLLYKQGLELASSEVVSRINSVGQL